MIIMAKQIISRPLAAHLSMFGAELFWGLMAPLGKDAMTHGIDGITMVTFRLIGGALLFWITALFVPKEHIPWSDRLKLIGAAILGLTFNQCCYTIGLGITSPTNSSIMTTSMPIFAMILSFVILHEPITMKKLGGVALGCIGALMLIMASASSGDSRVGDIRGDILCLCAQCSFAFYLALFSPLVKKYSTFTINRWMFLWATIMVVPFTIGHVSETDWSLLPTSTWLEIAFVVVCGTYISYILTMIGQRTLRPTVVSIYNYVQPVVSVGVSVMVGIGVLKWTQAIAVVFVFTGVWLVTKSKSKRDLEKENS